MISFIRLQMTENLPDLTRMETAATLTHGTVLPLFPSSWKRTGWHESNEQAVK